MPIYEYRCPSCGHELEALQKMSDAPLDECPDCKKSGLKKLMSTGGFSFKEKSGECGPGACGTSGCPAMQ